MNSQLIQIEANIDNMNPELYGPLLDTLLKGGANDAWLTPIIMKREDRLLCSVCWHRKNN